MKNIHQCLHGLETVLVSSDGDQELSQVLVRIHQLQSVSSSVRVAQVPGEVEAGATEGGFQIWLNKFILQLQFKKK